MESQEEQEITPKEGRGRKGNIIPITLHLNMTDHGHLSTSRLRMMRRLGADVTQERVVSEALQVFIKSFNSQD